ncbi:HIT family protein [Methylopila turkensis]|uniref:HIT family protein n=1 Tax=Methylopila turkensis TaxID=1437816 RepID=A0A9W6JNF6_9HYPH|nr:HIT family protein [Methylopila turkensis]GLK80317.1 HIT family protein [Methylopila turkensis]
MANATMTKFGYPGAAIREAELWSVQVRPKQPGFGSLVLVSKEPAQAFGALSAAAFAELGTLVPQIEAALKAVTGYDRINYLMLMMVDPDVHFHVIPRHEAPRDFAGLTFRDAGWPGPPALGEGPELDAAAIESLKNEILRRWPSA